MPRPSAPNKSDAASSDETPAEIRLHERHRRRLHQALDQVRKFHHEGVASLERYPDRVAYGSMKTVEDKGKNPEMLRKARQFANPETGYTRHELEALLKRCERAVFPLGISHIIRLIGIPKSAGQRKFFEKQMIDGGWSRRRLDMEVKKAIGPQRAFAGRPSRKPQDKDDALVLIAQVCRRWEGLLHVLMPAGKPIVPLSATVTRRLREADAVMRELATQVGK